MLRLTDITIENFRGIASAKLSGLADVTVLVGRNNCGKTTVLEAVARVVKAYKGGPPFDPAQRSIEDWFDLARRNTSVLRAVGRAGRRGQGSVALPDGAYHARKRLVDARRA